MGPGWARFQAPPEGRRELFSPSVGVTAATLRDYFGRYFLAKLNADPELAPVAEEFGAAQTGLAQRMTNYHDAVGQTLDAYAARDRVKEAMGDAVRDFSHTLRRVTRNDYRSPLYRSYFPEGTPKLTASPTVELIDKVEKLLERLTTEPDPALQSHIDPLTSALNNLKEGVRIYQEAVSASGKAATTLHQEKLLWIDRYRQAHAKLRIHFHVMPKRADRFFRRPRRPKATDLPEPEVETQTGAEAEAAGSTATTS